MNRSPLVLAILIAAAGCRSKQAPPVQPTPAAPTASAQGAPHGAMTAAVEGTVLERLEASPYSYLRLKTAQGETWVAVPAAPVPNGAFVRVVNPMEQRNWDSPKLKRKFDLVYLGTLGDLGAAEGGSAMPASPHGAAPAAPAVPIKVAKAEGAEGRTVAECHAQRKAMDGKTVAVRGKVVKRTSGLSVKGIQGSIWIHIQDGTGTPATDGDLTVATEDDVAVGDVVVARGRLKADPSIGSGYDRSLLMEGAKVRKEK